MKKVLLSALIFTITTSVFGQAALVETVNAEEGKLIVPYKRYVLPNGLNLIVSEDHSDPVAHINVTYHVGSARETPGKSGFAHFFEHMLFQGSKHVADEEHFKLIKQYGGEVNGNTTRDRTVYIETFPSNFTETALWMEADRMGFFLEGFTNKKFENQRSTVKNEKDQRYGVPYGFLMEVKDQQLYEMSRGKNDPIHPYSWSTIGFVDDLNRADSNDLRNFFLRWYGPNNACIIVSGDVVTKDVVKWTEKYFGGIPKGKTVRDQRIKPVQLDKNLIKSYDDPNAYVPLMYITYPGVYVMHKDEAALDLLSYLMGSTKSSPIYKAFMDTELALQANASNNPLSAANHELAGEFSFTLVGYPWSDMYKLRSRLFEVIDSFEYTGFSDDDLARAKANITSSIGNGLENVSTKASILSQSWYLNARNDSNQLFSPEDAITAFNSVTKEDIMRVYKRYLKGKNSATIDIKPLQVQDGEKAAKYESYNPNVDFNSVNMNLEYQNLRERVVKDNFDRSVRPTPSGIKPVAVPEIYKYKLSNGVDLWGTEFNETSKVLIRISTDGGSILENGKENPWGVSSLTANALEAGTKNKTPEELEKELEKLGARISFSASDFDFVISLFAPVQNLDASINLLKEMMFEPRWDEDEFKKSRKRIVESAKSSLKQRSAGMRNAWNRLVYGDESPLGRFYSPDDFAKLEISDCQEYYQKYFTSGGGKVIVVGPVSSEDIKSKLSFLESWEDKGVEMPKVELAEDINTTQIFGIQYTDAEQSDIIIGFRSLPFDYNGDYFKSNVMNFALGGNFNSRLNLNIREDKGWTYGIRGSFGREYEDLPGYYTIQTGVKSEATDSAINEILWSVENYKQNGITDEEFEFTKSALVASQALDYQSLGQKASFMYQMQSRNLPLNFAEEQLKTIKSLTKEEINKLAKEQLKTDKMIIVVAGDMVLLEDRLSDLGFKKITILDKDGKGRVKFLKEGKTNHKKRQ